MSGNKPRLTAEDAVAFLTSAFGEIQDFHALSEGEESRAFGFTRDGEPLVLRVNISRHGFEMDRMARERFGPAGLPVPAIGLIAPLGPYHACVSERASGTTLQGLAADDAYRHGAAICQLLDQMGRCDMAWSAGYGPISPDGRGRYENWPDFLVSLMKKDWSLLSSTQAAHLSPLLKRIENEAKGAENVRGLIHGDFGSNNVLVAAGRVTGLIDWSEAMVGNPLYDLANIFFWRPWLDCMEQQCRYIIEKEPGRLAQRDRIAALAIHIGLETAHEAAQAGDRALTDWALSRCTTLLETGI
ncbi:MAG TPA: phosphotransferase [Devosia sp.]|nr:phosphotransferase [Devosia sp.]